MANANPLPGSRSTSKMASCDFLFDNKAILEISEKYEKTAAEMMLRWSIQENALPIQELQCWEDA